MHYNLHVYIIMLTNKQKAVTFNKTLVEVQFYKQLHP